jgi:hypothetical protein
VRRRLVCRNLASFLCDVGRCKIFGLSGVLESVDFGGLRMLVPADF